MSECDRCYKEESDERHTCPYNEEIYEDHETECNCCEACTHECAMDI